VNEKSPDAPAIAIKKSDRILLQKKISFAIEISSSFFFLECLRSSFKEIPIIPIILYIFKFFYLVTRKRVRVT